eukprot:s1952_g12.t1
MDDSCCCPVYMHVKRRQKWALPPGHFSRIYRVIGRVVAARGLPNTDTRGKSDPYCVVKGIRSNNHMANIWITKAVQNTLSPHWEDINFEGGVTCAGKLWLNSSTPAAHFDFVPFLSCFARQLDFGANMRLSWSMLAVLVLPMIGASSASCSGPDSSCAANDMEETNVLLQMSEVNEGTDALRSDYAIPPKEESGESGEETGEKKAKKKGFFGGWYKPHFFRHHPFYRRRSPRPHPTTSSTTTTTADMSAGVIR